MAKILNMINVFINQKENSMDIKPGDEITMNGTVVSSIPNLLDYNNPMIVVRLNSGIDIHIYEKDINTIHPYVERDDVDHRKGN